MYLVGHKIGISWKSNLKTNKTKTKNEKNKKIVVYLKSVSERSNYRCVPQIGFWDMKIIVVYLKWVSAKSVCLFYW